MVVDDVESGDEPLAPLLIEGANRAAQALDRFGQIVALGDELVAARKDLNEFVVGAQVDRAEPLALLAQILELALDLDAAGQRLIGFMIGKRCEARWLAIEFARDRVLKLFVPCARAFQALFRGGALLARGAHGFERLTRGAIGVGERGFAQRERVGGLLARGLRLAVLVGKRAPRPGKVGRRIGELRPLSIGFGLPLGELGDAALRAIAPLMPGRPLCDDCAASRGARRSLAGNGLRRRPSFGEGGSIERGSHPRVLEARRDIISRPKLIKRGLRAGFAFGSLIARCASARKGLFHSRQARKGLSARALELRQGVASGIRCSPGGARPPTPFRFRRSGFAGRARRACRFCAQRRCRLARRLSFALKVA